MIEKKRLFFLILFPSFLAGLIFLGVYFFSPGNTPRTPPPVFEEIYSSRSDLREKIRDIDYAVYESLYRSGALERDISFQNVEPRHQNGRVWDFTEISVKCPGRKCARNLQIIITHGLTALGPEISYRYEKTPDNEIVCHISAQGFYTHKIVLKFDSQRLPVKDFRSSVAIIIDDLGYDQDIAFSFIHLDLPISLSVLPCAPYTDLIVREATENGCELILHLPMEPKQYPSVKPGPGALFLSMEKQEILQMLDQDLEDIPGAKGVNNHMGSSFTENREKMVIVLKELKKRNLFYVDSRTTSNTVGFKLAKNMGLPAAKRSVFLDNDLAPKAIRMQLERLLSMARHSGSAIGIGHPHKETLEILREYHSGIKAEFHVVPVSELVR
ncbi:MAG: divergent polysaccharide deacetylase family protein [Deltaproteobacteria bacterium]|nr:divergent polysaccharide deacetylase family protein [Deltaproteobacteria bacterium]MBW2116542.1 divergent polysaccharide deacetylase family protein [Deltaproteobacteria bacterium]MBW2345225.1 divergent polysaccharide deacetylase family protein [Deltaproteobacteria bacterium]